MSECEEDERRGEGTHGLGGLDLDGFLEFGDFELDDGVHLPVAAVIVHQHLARLFLAAAGDEPTRTLGAKPHAGHDNGLKATSTCGVAERFG